MTNRREFLLGAGAIAAGTGGAAAGRAELDEKLREAGKLIVKPAALPITGTFLDEVSYDIPHQNWGVKEWDADFGHMKAIGIDTVIMIRCGLRKFLACPSKQLLARGCYTPSTDLAALFLRLAEKHGMSFYFGLYDPGCENTADENPWLRNYTKVNLPLVEEIWRTYGRYPAFKGWYLSSEFSTEFLESSIDTVRQLGKRCKDVSGGLPVLISPYIIGRKCALIKRMKRVPTLDEHKASWNEIFDAVHDVLDICAFQDGFIDYSEVEEYAAVNRELCKKYGIRCWTNAESFDRDMPINFPPIKFDKLRLKLEGAARGGCEKAITFEFSHFMSPQSMYPSAAGLYNRYREYMGV